MKSVAGRALLRLSGFLARLSAPLALIHQLVGISIMRRIHWPETLSTRPLLAHCSVSAFHAAATVAILFLALTGCNGTLPAVPTEVKIPVPVPCVAQADIPQATFATDAELAALPDGPFVLALARDRLERQGHIAILESILQACAEKSPVSGAKTTSGEGQ